MRISSFHCVSINLCMFFLLWGFTRPFILEATASFARLTATQLNLNRPRERKTHHRWRWGGWRVCSAVASGWMSHMSSSPAGCCGRWPGPGKVGYPAFPGTLCFSEPAAWVPESQYQAAPALHQRKTHFWLSIATRVTTHPLCPGLGLFFGPKKAWNVRDLDLLHAGICFLQSDYFLCAKRCFDSPPSILSLVSFCLQSEIWSPYMLQTDDLGLRKPLFCKFYSSVKVDLHLKHGARRLEVDLATFEKEICAAQSATSLYWDKYVF